MTTSAMSPVRWAGLAAAVHGVSWPGAAAIMMVLLAVMLFRLLAERARRKTLIELVQRAPGGTVVMQAGGPGGPAVRVRVGAGQPGVTGGGLP